MLHKTPTTPHVGHILPLSDRDDTNSRGVPAAARGQHLQLEVARPQPRRRHQLRRALEEGAHGGLLWMPLLSQL